MVILNNPLPLGVRYWYMKQSVEMGWSSNVLKMQIESNLYDRQIKSNKVNNFTATLPAPQSDLANYLLKDPYIFDLAGAKEKADERDIEEQLVKHVDKNISRLGTVPFSPTWFYIISSSTPMSSWNWKQRHSNRNMQGS